MAEIVAAFGVPHTPSFVAHVAREGPECDVAQLFRSVQKHLDAVDPDIIVIFDSDHFNTFFLNNWPTFAIGIAQNTAGPNDQTPMMPWYVVPTCEPLAQHLQVKGVEDGFDLSFSQEFEVDHSILVPLHFLTPKMTTPIVPVFINGLAPPLPAARRCYALGQMVRAAIETWPAQMRVAVLASGSWSLEVGGPRMHAGKIYGVPDLDWFYNIQGFLQRAQIDELLNATTSSQLAKAGNIGGELLNWIAMLGVLGKRRPTYLEAQADFGNAFAAWRFD